METNSRWTEAWSTDMSGLRVHDTAKEAESSAALAKGMQNGTVVVVSFCGFPSAARFSLGGRDGNLVTAVGASEQTVKKGWTMVLINQVQPPPKQCAREYLRAHRQGGHTVAFVVPPQHASGK